MSGETATVHHLTAHGYDLTVDVEHGASLTALRWRKTDGTWFEVLHPCPPANTARTGGCFVMAPFANRLDGGRFPGTAGPIPLPTRIEKFCVIRSPFIDKDSQEQFEIRTHKRLIDVLEPSGSTIRSLMRLNLPAGVDIEIKL